MTCKCTDEKGILLDKCIGNCCSTSEFVINKEQKRNEIQIMMDAIIDRVDKKIDQALKYQRVEFAEDQMKLYKQAFKEGFEEGFISGRES